jgi:hypothetical protein
MTKDILVVNNDFLRMAVVDFLRKVVFKVITGSPTGNSSGSAVNYENLAFTVTERFFFLQGHV